MKASRRETKKPFPAPSPAPAAQASRWIPYSFAAAAVLAAIWAYMPAAHGPFLFDDALLPFARQGFSTAFRDWVYGQRPLLMASYWINFWFSGDDSSSYHSLNVIVHCLCAGLIFLIVRRLMEWAEIDAGRRKWIAALAAAVFLLHPVQTEAVAYLAGRSEALSTLFAMSAYAVFLYRRNATISWNIVAVLLALFLAALLTKEQTIVLPALLLLTDYWWNSGFQLEGIRRNWRLYALLGLGAAYAVTRYWPLIVSATTESAGFHMKDLTWYQYFFTQCRALFVYLWLFLFPANLTADWDFPISKTIVDRGAVAGLIVLVALAGIAWRYRREYRLASFGFFAFLILMAPTSSVVPIRDPIAERRLYFSMLGLLLIVADVLARVRVERKVLAVAVCVLAVVLALATHARAEVWSSAITLWEDTAQKSPDKMRVHFQLASSYCGSACGGIDEGPPHCDLAVREYEKTAQLEKPNYNLLVDWAAAYDCLHQPENALAKLRQAAAVDSTAHVYTQIAKVYGEQQRWAEALDALSTAEKLEPNYAVTFAYRGLVHMGAGQSTVAVADFQRALALDPALQPAKDGLAQARERVREGK